MDTNSTIKWFLYIFLILVLTSVLFAVKDKFSNKEAEYLSEITNLRGELDKALNANKVLSDELNKTKSQCDINASSINSLSKKISDQSKKVDDILEQRNRKIYSTLNKSESKKQDTGVKNQVETLSDDTIENISRENIETLNRVYITVK